MRSRRATVVLANGHSVFVAIGMLLVLFVGCTKNTRPEPKFLAGKGCNGPSHL